jgi:hypothetical protein
MAQKPKEKVKINVQDVLNARKFLRSVNKHEVKDIEWLGANGQPLKISDKAYAEFEYLGLNNSDFIDMGFYRS